jgi:hypothetical protein
VQLQFQWVQIPSNSYVLVTSLVRM